MTYQVLNEFIEKEHENILYKTGEVYPKEGFDADPKRVAFLQSKENKYKKAFLGPEIEEAESAEPKKESKKKTSTKK